MGYKIRESQAQKIPLTLIIGDQEKNDNTVSYRKFGSQTTITKKIFEFISELDDCLKFKKNNL